MDVDTWADSDQLLSLDREETAPAASPVVSQPVKPAAPVRATTEGIRWVSQAEADASPLPRYLLASIDDGSCVPCNRLAEALKSPQVVELSRHYDCVKTNRSSGGFPMQQWGDGTPLAGWSEPFTAEDLARHFSESLAPPTAIYVEQLSVDQQPTPMEGVAATLRALNPQPHEVLVDYGCGFDARYLITACRQYHTHKAIGIEIDPEVAASARAYVVRAGLSDRITIINGDATKVDVTADIGVAYLWPEVLEQLKPRINRLKRFASYAHAIPGIPSTPQGDVYLYTKSTPVPVSIQRPITYEQPTYQRPVAVWGGRTYTSPVCNRRGCSMCNAIRSQLGR